MRTSTMLLAASALLAQTARAQNKTDVEIGTALGVTFTLPAGGDIEVFAGVPGAGTLLGAPSLYLTFFPSPAFMVEPQLALEFNTLSDQATISPMLQIGYLFAPDAKGSGYVAFNGGGLYRTESAAASSASLGAGFGYRVKVSTGAAFRTEVLYRRWLSERYKLNDVSVRFAFGAIF